MSLGQVWLEIGYTPAECTFGAQRQSKTMKPEGIAMHTQRINYDKPMLSSQNIHSNRANDQSFVSGDQISS